MKATKKSIETFLSGKIAIAGVSRNEKKFGHMIFKEMMEKGYDVVPVNSNTDSINGMQCYRSVNDIPGGISKLVLLTQKNQTLEVLQQAKQKGISEVWIQQMSETPEVIKFADENFNVVVSKQCLFMFVSPVKGIHKFHRTMKALFGALPK